MKRRQRRLTVGLLLSAVPVPGMVHYYAGEKRTQRRILAASALGLGTNQLGRSPRI